MRLFSLSLRSFSFIIACVALLACPVWAQTASPDLQKANSQKLAITVTYFLDATGQKTVEQVEQMQAVEFASFSPERPIAIKNGALWLRFSATNQTNQLGWRLIVPMATVDDVSLFNRSADGQWIKQLGGDTRPISTWAQPGRYPSFVLSDDRGRAVDYFLQVRHERGLYSMLPRVMSEKAFITSRQNEHTVLGMYFGLAVLVVILALSRGLVYRDSGFASYALYVALLALSIATISGISGLYLWPEWPISTVISPLLSTSTSAAGCWFVRVVTRPKRFSRWLDRALMALMVISPLSGVLAVFQPSGLAYTIYSAVVLISTSALLLTIVAALWQRDHDSRWVALGFFPIVIAVFIPVLRNFGLIPASSLTELSIPIASAIEVVILFYGLHRRVSQPRSVATRMTKLLQIDPLTGLHTRQVVINHLSTALTTAQKGRQPYALLLIHLPYADAIERKYGRETADRMMVQAASCIRSDINPGDTLSRVGVAQFALLLESPVTEPEVNSIATKILANALRKSMDLPADQALRFHIALGYPDVATLSTSRDAESILERLLNTASAIDAQSNKVIRAVTIP
jgi:two-component system, sensor histidine kinase LadS